MIIKTKEFESELLIPLVVPDGNSLEEKMNTFLNTLDPKNVLDVLVSSYSSAKYGIRKTNVGTVVYLG